MDAVLRQHCSRVDRSSAWQEAHEGLFGRLLRASKPLLTFGRWQFTILNEGLRLLA